MMFKRIVQKAKRVSAGIVGVFRKRPEIQVAGLREGDTAFKESIEEECRKTLGKIRKMLAEAEGIEIYVKATGEGKQRLYELKGTLFTDRGELHASAEGRELYGALTRVLYEFENEARRAKSWKNDKRL
ncbi:hypothetical protein COU36_00625 [Candidatus Micrarchaeota archaeon CG10_big_fil_rev_8_21_14_0_10_59_7]|nr:MAG: hypothetical protein COU36_00625 [Candidatus Micrarchaeota archaeon CG10_big_fil_rev_8_21_14_0_10_59_7]